MRRGRRCSKESVKRSIHRACSARAQTGENRLAQSPSDTAEHRVRTQALKGRLKAAAEDFGAGWRVAGSSRETEAGVEWDRKNHIRKPPWQHNEERIRGKWGWEQRWGVLSGQNRMVGLDGAELAAGSSGLVTRWAWEGWCMNLSLRICITFINDTPLNLFIIW